MISKKPPVQPKEWDGMLGIFSINIMLMVSGYAGLSSLTPQLDIAVLPFHFNIAPLAVQTLNRPSAGSSVGIDQSV